MYFDTDLGMERILEMRMPLELERIAWATLYALAVNRYS